MLLSLVTSALLATQGSTPSDAEAAIRAKTKQFTQAIVSGDLSVLDAVFEADPGHQYYDINEGLVGFARLKRVWTAATTNFKISKFEFGDDMKVIVDGESATQFGTWVQTQVSKDGSSRDINGRATILWRKRNGEWRVWHYHGSITPRRGPGPGGPGPTGGPGGSGGPGGRPAGPPPAPSPTVGPSR